MKLCFEAHKEQTDKGGLPYVFHPFHLAEQMTNELTTIVALLHDVVEDTDYSIDDLRRMGYPEAALEALTRMTHADHVPYMEYIAAMKSNPIAKCVKIADLQHNSDLTRLDAVDTKAIARAEKYRKAIELLAE